MAKIIENEVGRRMIKLSVDDVISVVREYQRIIKNPKSYDGIRAVLVEKTLFLPEEI